MTFLALALLLAQAQPSPDEQARSCSDAALSSYAATSPDPAKDVAEAAFASCRGLWLPAAEQESKRIAATPEAVATEREHIRIFGKPSGADAVAIALEAAHHFYVSDAATAVFRLRASKGSK